MTLIEALVALAITSIVGAMGAQAVRWTVKLVGGVQSRLEAEEQRISFRLGADCGKTMAHAPATWSPGTPVAIYTKRDKILIATSAGKLRGQPARASMGASLGTFVIETKDSSGAWRDLRGDIPYSCI